MQDERIESWKLHRGSTEQLTTITWNTFEENPTHIGPTIDPGIIRVSDGISLKNQRSRNY